MSISQKQLAANRRNSKHPTGPKTPEGKANTCQNPVKHPSTPQNVIVIAADTPRRPGRLRPVPGDLRKSCEPVGNFEGPLVEQVAPATGGSPGALARTSDLVATL